MFEWGQDRLGKIYKVLDKHEMTLYIMYITRVTELQA